MAGGEDMSKLTRVAVVHDDDKVYELVESRVDSQWEACRECYFTGKCGPGNCASGIDCKGAAYRLGLKSPLRYKWVEVTMDE